MNIENEIKENLIDAVMTLYQYGCDDFEKLVQIELTRPEFEGDYTVIVFPLLKISGKSPVQTGGEIGDFIIKHNPLISGYKVIGGFLNLTVDCKYWLSFLNEINSDPYFWMAKNTGSSPTVMVEFSSPNTNKPLHLGHIRNILIGNSLAEILKAAGNNVIKTTLVNDRGIHICKSMLAWMKWGEGTAPDLGVKKGDHLVGDYYVLFEKEYKKQVRELTEKGLKPEEAEKTAPLLAEAQELLIRWEANDPETIALWKTMNSWVYDGFAKTYEKLNVQFDVTDYESEIFQLGRSIVLKGIVDGVFYLKKDGSVWIDLTDEGLDEKILLRSDGTSVYITQDIGTAHHRFNRFRLDRLIYVVGNEQNYHFKVLSLVLRKLGYSWAGNLHHLSYGMVELPSGKMKSREGTVVDADDLIEEMNVTARNIAGELGKLDDLPSDESEKVLSAIAMGALKYFILKVDPKKNMTFIPKESIDFNGNTGPFIQYTYARICSVFRKAKEQNIKVSGKAELNLKINNKEKELLKRIHTFTSVITEAADTYNPALVANFVYDFAKEYNQFYHDFTILKEENIKCRDFRLLLSGSVGNIIKSAMNLLGIEMTDRM
jgi:arginyl-tRNA synthetase